MSCHPPKSSHFLVSVRFFSPKFLQNRIVASRYATLYFEADGFKASQIGLLISLRRLIQTLSTPLWNALADKTKKARRGIVGTEFVGKAIRCYKHDQSVNHSGKDGLIFGWDLMGTVPSWLSCCLVELKMRLSCWPIG